MLRRSSLLLAIVLFAAPLFAGEAPVYKTNCQPCHGPDGTGSTPVGKSLHVKSLRSDEVQKLTDKELIKIIRDGKGKMPAFGGKLTDPQVEDIIHFIRGLAPHK